MPIHIRQFSVFCRLCPGAMFSPSSTSWEDSWWRSLPVVVVWMWPWGRPRTPLTLCACRTHSSGSWAADTVQMLWETWNHWTKSGTSKYAYMAALLCWDTEILQGKKKINEYIWSWNFPNWLLRLRQLCFELQVFWNCIFKHANEASSYLKGHHDVLEKKVKLIICLFTVSMR